MKKYIILPVALMCAACVSVEKITSEAQEFASQLETDKDPIKVIEAYKTYTGLCHWKWWAGAGYNLAPDQAECIRRDSMAERGIDFICVGLSTSYNDDKKYDSDECILYRRSEKFHKSDVEYFDYKRFLGATSPIKTDKDFLKLVERYNNISECDKLSETTEVEKEACKEKRRNEIRMLAKQSVPCMEFIKDEYIEKLNNAGKWYKWAINHDPNEGVRLMRSMGYNQYVSNLSYQPVWERAEARQEVKEKITEFGKENLCTTTDWQQEIKKLGFNL